MIEGVGRFFRSNRTDVRDMLEVRDRLDFFDLLEMGKNYVFTLEMLRLE